jgi:hypothetical protein
MFAPVPPGGRFDVNASAECALVCAAAPLLPLTAVAHFRVEHVAF